jgi:hypothetical protein
MMRTLLLIGMALLASLSYCQDDSGVMGGLAKPIEGRSRRVSSTFREGAEGRYDPHAKPKGDADPKSNWDNFTVAPGKTHVLMDEKGPGVITHIWMTFLGPEPQDWAKNGSADVQEMLLRIYYDGNPRPGVEAPVGDFFANCFGKRREVISLPVVVDHGNSYNCFWRMPFRKSIRIEIVNQGTKPISHLYYNIDWMEKPNLATNTPYFYAQYRQEYPVKPGTDYVILDTKGKGHYVGTVLAVRTRSPMWFGEGDEKVYIDGEKDASIWGTGTEDYFMMAWGLKETKGPYSGCPYFDQWGMVGQHASAYRWHLNDPIVFNTGIRMTIEHYGWMSPDETPSHQTSGWTVREDDFASVAFWYQTGEPTFAARAPSAPERRLPSLERETAYARDSATHGDGDAERQSLEFYDGAQLLYEPQHAEGAWLEIPFTVSQKEPLRLLLNMTTSYDFGIYQAYLDGVKLGTPIDFYSPAVANREFPLLDFWPDRGPHKLRLECVGKSAASRGYFLGIESVRLRQRRPRVAAFGWDRGLDWKKNPILYGG